MYENYDVELEKWLIKKYKFRRSWFQDKSGYWLEKSFKIMDFKAKIYLETDNKKLGLTIYESSNNYQHIDRQYKYSKSNIIKLCKRIKE